MINLHERMLPTSAGVEPATSWSPVGRRIQMSHRGRLKFDIEPIAWCHQSFCDYVFPLRKHAYSNILKISCPKTENFQIKNSDSFLISAQNIDCGYLLEPPWWGGSNEYPQSMFLSRNKKNNVYPCKPQFYYIKVGLRGSVLYRRVFVMHCDVSQRFPMRTEPIHVSRE